MFWAPYVPLHPPTPPLRLQNSEFFVFFLFTHCSKESFGEQQVKNNKYLTSNNFLSFNCLTCLLFIRPLGTQNYFNLSSSINTLEHQENKSRDGKLVFFTLWSTTQVTRTATVAFTNTSSTISLVYVCVGGNVEFPSPFSCTIGWKFFRCAKKWRPCQFGENEFLLVFSIAALLYRPAK